MTDFHIRTTCRLCESPTELALELPPTPPANELVTREFVESGKVQDVFPLPVVTCTACGHVQLSCVVDPERLFRNYPYRSGASPVFREHLRKYAESVIGQFGMPRVVVEIGSNDGTFLEHFRQRGSDVWGVDPFDAEVDYPLIRRPFSRSIAEQLRRRPGSEGRELVDLIVANHVFAHADDLKDIALGVRELLSDDGVFVFEVGYLVDVVEKGLFDVIYHEHLSYHHLAPLLPFFERLGLNLYDAERVDTQGGSIRCYVSKEMSRGGSVRLQNLIKHEESVFGLSPSNVNLHIAAMGERVLGIRRELTGMGVKGLGMLRDLKLQGKRIAGYGAPAKCCTLMHTLGFGPDVLDFIVEDSPVKHGFFTPGKHVEILPVSALYERKPDYVLVLAWNFAESIMTKHPSFKFIVPLPKVETILPNRQVAL